MVIENLNKYSEEQIASLQEKENVIRLIISEQPNRCNLEHLRKYAIKSDTNIQLCLCAEDNNIIKFDVFECLAEKVVDIEIYNRKRVLTSIIGISIFRNLNKLIISDLYDDKIVLDELVQLEKLEILGLVLNGDLDMRQYETINQLFSLRRLEVKGLDSMLLDKLPNLENLKCHNLKDGTQLGYKMPNLKSITIYKSPKIRDLNFLLGMKMIQCIYLYGLSNLSHVPNLCNLPNLRRIGICNMKRLEQMPTLNRELESLDVEKNVPMLGVDSILRLWCKKASNDTYIVDNVPFYTYGISLGDEICVTEEDGEYHFQSIVNPSGNSTLRVHFNDKRMQMVRDKLLDMGCKVEISNLPSFVSINVPQEVSLKVVEDVLTNMQKECDSLAYEHGVVRQNIS